MTCLANRDARPVAQLRGLVSGGLKLGQNPYLYYFVCQTFRLTYEDRNKKKEAKEYKVWEAIQTKAKESKIVEADQKVEVAGQE